MSLKTGHSAECRRLQSALEAERERAESQFHECLAQKQLASQLRERLGETHARRTEYGAAVVIASLISTIASLIRTIASHIRYEAAVVAAIARAPAGSPGARQLEARVQAALATGGGGGSVSVGGGGGAGSTPSLTPSLRSRVSSRMHSQLPSPLAGLRKGGFGTAAAAPLPSPLPSPLAGLRKGGFGTGFFPPALETTTTPSPKNASSTAAAEATAEAAAGGSGGGSGGGRSSVGARSIFDDDGTDGRVHDLSVNDLSAFAPSGTASERGGSSERGDGGAGGGDGDSDAPAFLLELEQELRYSVGREQDAATYARMIASLIRMIAVTLSVANKTLPRTLG